MLTHLVGETNKAMMLSDQIRAVLLKLASTIDSEIGRPTIILSSHQATIKQIIETERRLGVPLPQDYIELLYVANGFYSSRDWVEANFDSIDMIDWLHHLDPFLIECYEDTLPELQRCILIGGVKEEEKFLIIPPNDSNQDRWRYWEFANWRPGNYEHLDILTYLHYRLSDVLKESD